MEAKDKRLKVLLLVIIISHIVCATVGLKIIDPYHDYRLLMRIVLVFPILSEICFIILIIGDNVLWMFPAIVHIVALNYYIYTRYFKNKLISEINIFIQGLIYYLVFIALFPVFIFNSILTEYFDEIPFLKDLTFLKGLIATITFILGMLSVFWFFGIYLKGFIDIYLTRKLIVKQGLEPFSTKTLDALLDGKCSICGSRIKLDSLLGNSLVVDKKEITIKCLKCRTGLDIVIPDHRDVFDRIEVLLNMQKFSSTSSINALLSLRMLKNNVDDAPSENTWRRSFSININSNDYYWIWDKPVAEKYGILAGNSCGECGAFFKEDLDIYDSEEFIQNGECPRCKLPNKYQWFLRTTFEAERVELINNKSLEQPIVLEKIEDRILREKKLADAETQLHEAKLQLEKDPGNKVFQRKLRVKQAVYAAHKSLADIKNKS